MKKIMIVLVTLLLTLPISAIQAAYAGPSRPVTWHVYPGQSIQAVLDSANAKDTIIVHEGEYHQSILISKSTSLVGDGAILEGTPPADGGTVLTSDAITIAGAVSGVTIKRFEITDYTNGIQASDGGTRNINIVANVIHDISYDAVTAAGTGLHENWFINGNTIRNVMYGDGIYVAQAKRLVISNNLIDQASSGIWVHVPEDSTHDSEGVTVTGNKVTNGGLAPISPPCIFIYDESRQAQAKRIVIMRNTVSNCHVDGIDLFEKYAGESGPPIEDVVVFFNTVDSNWGQGIGLAGVAGGRVSANTITNNHLEGIWCYYCSKITISGNLIHHNFRDGISIVSSSDNNVLANTVTESRYGIYLASGDDTPPSRNVIMLNTAEGNIQYDLYWDETGTGNVWKLNRYDTKNW